MICEVIYEIFHIYRTADLKSSKLCVHNVHNFQASIRNCLNRDQKKRVQNCDDHKI